MQIIKIFFLINIWSYLLTSCIEPYEATEVSQESLVVVNATINDDTKAQSIVLAKSSSIFFPTFKPISDAKVIVTDTGNNVFEFTESFETKGTYIGNIASEFLTIGNAFKLNFVSAEGAVYESDFEAMLACPPIDSLYYDAFIEFYEGNNNFPMSGIEFFVDIRADQSHSEFYRWQLDETYEYHGTWPILTYYSGGRYITRDEALWNYFICYKSEPINSIFSTTTKYLDQNVYLKLPLNFVSTETQRLYFKYSLLVKQMSITERAFYYYEALKGNNQTSGGLYDKQPINVRGNIVCLSNPNEKVLGYFGVSSMKIKRLSLIGDDLKGKVNFDNNVFCVAEPLDHPEILAKSTKADWPIYLAPVPDGGKADGVYWAPKDCFDCRLKGGSLVIPEFWKGN